LLPRQKPVSLSDRFCFPDVTLNIFTEEAALAQSSLLSRLAVFCRHAHTTRGAKPEGTATDFSAHEQGPDRSVAWHPGITERFRGSDDCEPRRALRRDSERWLRLAAKPGSPIHRDTQSEHQSTRRFSRRPLARRGTPELFCWVRVRLRWPAPLRFDWFNYRPCWRKTGRHRKRDRSLSLS